MFSYALMSPDGQTIEEFRSFNDEPIVGPDAPGEFARMVPATPDQLVTLNAVAYVAPTPRQWLERLAPATQTAITGAAVANPAILLWLLKAAGTTNIDVTNPDTIAGVAALVGAGVLTSADEATLLAP